MNLKTCNRCNQSKPYEQFKYDISKEDCFSAWCKECLFKFNNQKPKFIEHKKGEIQGSYKTNRNGNVIRKPIYDQNDDPEEYSDYLTDNPGNYERFNK